MKKTLLFSLLFTIIFSISATEKQKTLFVNIDFKQGEWLLVHEEIEFSIDSQGNSTRENETVSIISDVKILDTLISEIKCDSLIRFDGGRKSFKHFVITLYHNKKQHSAFVYQYESNYELGEIKKHFLPVDKTDLTCFGYEEFNLKRANYVKQQSPYVFYTLNEKGYKSIDGQFKEVSRDTSLHHKFLIIISLHNDGELNSRRAITAFKTVYPELETVYYGMFSNENYMDKGDHYYTIEIFCEKNFQLNLSKLANNKVIKTYDVIGTTPLKYYLTGFVLK